jgi:hypothetical protein
MNGEVEDSWRAYLGDQLAGFPTAQPLLQPPRWRRWLIELNHWAWVSAAARAGYRPAELIEAARKEDRC